MSGIRKCLFSRRTFKKENYAAAWLAPLKIRKIITYHHLMKAIISGTWNVNVDVSNAIFIRLFNLLELFAQSS